MENIAFWDFDTSASLECNIPRKSEILCLVSIGRLYGRRWNPAND